MDLAADRPWFRMRLAEECGEGLATDRLRMVADDRSPRRAGSVDDDVASSGRFGRCLWSDRGHRFSGQEGRVIRAASSQECDEHCPHAGLRPSGPAAGSGL